MTSQTQNHFVKNNKLLMPKVFTQKFSQKKKKDFEKFQSNYPWWSPLFSGIPGCEMKTK